MSLALQVVGGIDQTSERQADYASRATAVFATCRPRVIDSVYMQSTTTQNEEFYTSNFIIYYTIYIYTYL